MWELKTSSRREVIQLFLFTSVVKIQHRKPFEPRPEVACEAAALATSSDWRVVLGDWPRDMLGLATSSDWRVVLGDWPRDMVSLQTSGLVGLVLTSKTHRPGSIRLHAIESRPGSLDSQRWRRVFFFFFFFFFGFICFVLFYRCGDVQSERKRDRHIDRDEREIKSRNRRRERERESVCV